MFSSSKNKSYKNSSFSQSRVTKQSSKKQRSFRDHASSRNLKSSHTNIDSSPETSPNLNSAIVTISVGPSQRLFAAHEDLLCRSPYFETLCRQQFFDNTKRIVLVDEEPEIFSSVLEYLYKGDYYPKLNYDKKRQSWHLEDQNEQQSRVSESTVYHHGAGGYILKDSAIYCAALHLTLPDLARLALKKQSLHSTTTSCTTILLSARFAYAHTPDTDSRLRAHYLALIIRSRSTFKKSGTMQREMEMGGGLFFDLFVALVNHLDDVQGIKSPR